MADRASTDWAADRELERTVDPLFRRVGIKLDQGK
jgi:hypothetical protein